jgi:hypothetical protein
MQKMINRLQRKIDTMKRRLSDADVSAYDLQFVSVFLKRFESLVEEMQVLENNKQAKDYLARKKKLLAKVKEILRIYNVSAIKRMTQNNVWIFNFMVIVLFYGLRFFFPHDDILQLDAENSEIDEVADAVETIQNDKMT